MSRYDWVLRGRVYSTTDTMIRQSVGLSGLPRLNIYVWGKHDEVVKWCKETGEVSTVNKKKRLDTR